MGLQRIAISNPAANTATKIFTAGDPYLLSVIATNKSASASNIRVWVQPNGASAEAQYAFIVYEIPVDANNSFETFRFAINALDDVYVQSSTASVSFHAYGLTQYDVKLGAGVSSYSPNEPANPVNGMIWVDSDGSVFGSSAKPIYIYNSASGTWDSTAASGINTASNYTWTGNNTFNGTNVLSASTSIGNISATEIDYLNNASANIQDQLNLKAPIASPTFTGTTTASVAVIQGNLTVDTNTLFVDSINNRIGIGTITPSFPLDASGTISVSATNGNKIAFNASDTFSSNSTTGAHYGMTFGVPANARVSISGWDGVHLWTGGISRLQVDGAGRILMPNQPAFRVGRGSNYNPGANTDIVFDITSSGSHFNNGNHYNSANGRFVAPVAGKYLFSTNIIWTGVASGTNMTDALYINKNGSLMVYGNRRSYYSVNVTGDAGYYTDHASVILDLAANDYVTVYNLRNYTVHGNSNYSWFMGYLIG